MPRQRLIPIILVLVGVAVCGVGFWQYHGHYTDDAYISLRYCYNFLHGDGLVWNPGERVEGYTNFLMVILTSLLGKIGIDLVAATRVIGLGAFFGLLLFLFMRARKTILSKSSDPYLSALPLLLTATSFCMIAWSVGGLETTLFCLLVTIGVLWLREGIEGDLRQVAQGSAILGLATLTRPDGGLFFVVAGLFYLPAVFSRETNSIRRLAALVIPFMLLVGTHEVWRYSYYGEFLPNTFYAKGVFNWWRAWLGIRYFSDFALTAPYLPILLLVGLIYRTFARSWDKLLTYFTVIIVIFSLYVAYPGGDHMSAFRPLVAVIPLMAILLGYSLVPLARKLNGKGSAAIVAFCSLLTIVQIFAPGPGFTYARHPDHAAYCGMIVGEYIRKVWPAGSLIALNSAGATPYFAPNDRFIDMLGLNDKTIARRDSIPIVSFYQYVPGHAKGDGKYVFERKPDYIIAGPSAGNDLYHSLTLTEYELARIFEFKSVYRLTSVEIPVPQYPGYLDHPATQSGKMLFTYYERVK